MNESMVIQGRKIGPSEVKLICEVMDQHEEWGRTRLSRELCELWSWRAASGQLKDMACRTLLLKLDRAGMIKLPSPRRPANNEIRNRSVRVVEHQTEAMACNLQDLHPLVIRLVEPRDGGADLFNCLLQKYHYLGHRSSVGESIRYLVSDAQGRPVSCVLFGSAAWALRPRDEYIGWKATQRRERLQWITNNTRFLVLPWVRVPNLASHLLSLICRRLREDWVHRYGHPISAVETFVDRSRFRGTCYQAANWRKLGQTTGRTRNSLHGEPLQAIKDVYLYPLTRRFRKELCAEHSSENIEGDGTVG
jgi:hypothetical protein